MLNWANQFNIFCLLDSNHAEYKSEPNQIMLAVATDATVTASANNLAALAKLHQFGDWLFGHLSFNLQTETEQIINTKTNPIGFADIDFFCPDYLITINNRHLTIESINDDCEDIISIINNTT